MKFGSIQEFMDLVPKCEHCGWVLGTFIKSKNIPTHAHGYTMGFDKTTFDDPFNIQLNAAFTDTSQVTYHSIEDMKFLHFCYKINESLNPIFSIDKTTNAVKGDRDKIQRVIWDHKPVIRKQCINDECHSLKRNYIYEGSPMVLERVNQRIYPFFLDTEVLTIGYNDSVYGLMTTYENRTTYLMAQHAMIKQLPETPLYRIKGSETIYNKIKTLINFS